MLALSVTLNFQFEFNTANQLGFEPGSLGPKAGTLTIELHSTGDLLHFLCWTKFYDFCHLDFVPSGVGSENDRLKIEKFCLFLCFCSFVKESLLVCLVCFFKLANALLCVFLSVVYVFCLFVCLGRQRCI